MRKTIYVVTLATLLFASCGSNKEPVVTLNTRFGDIKLILFDETPLHKKNYLELARSGAYDSTTFHRVIKGFMVQGGNLLAKGLEEPDLIPAEINEKFIHQRGAVAAARMGDGVNPERKSSGSHFYIVDGTRYTEIQLTLDEGKLNELFGQLVRLEKYKDLHEEMAALEAAGKTQEIRDKALEYKGVCEKEFGVELDRNISPEQMEAYTQKGGAPHLDGGYTVFGMVIHGMEVVDQIASQPVNPQNKPRKDIYLSVTVEEIPRRDITLRYGYSFPQ